MKTSIFVLLVLSFFAWSCANEPKDSVEKANSANEAKLDSADAGTAQPAIVADKETSDFLVAAANDGMAEIKLGELAQQKATNQNVKDFGAMMVRDHGAANDEVKALAARRNVTLPDSVSSGKKKDYDDLNKRSGAGFDRAFCRQMENDHESAVKTFKNAADKVNDAEVKTFINNTIPKLQHHLDSIKSIRKTVK